MSDGLIHSKSTSALASMAKYKTLYETPEENFLALQFGDARLTGNKRSLIRMIGSNLPLKNVDRPRFEILPSGIKVVESESKSTIFSLSDIGRLSELPGHGRQYLSQALLGKKDLSPSKSDFKDTASLSSGYATPIIPQEHMENKINALEDELSALRQQIAQLIAVQRPDTSSMNSSALQTTLPLDASTPIKPSIPIPPPPTPMATPGIPPPPPLLGIPPPPPIALLKEVKKSAPKKDFKQLIRERKLAKGKDVGAPQSNEVKPKPISMSDVLKDLHKVKLKSVDRKEDEHNWRSPGGTPMNKKSLPPNKKKEPVDSATFIQEALRRKFSRISKEKRNESTEDLKEWTDSPPRFGQHMLKKRSSPSKRGRKAPIPLPTEEDVIKTPEDQIQTSPAKN